MYWLRAMSVAVFALMATSCQPKGNSGNCQCECTCQFRPAAPGQVAAPSPAPRAVSPAPAAPAVPDTAPSSEKILLGHVGTMSGPNATYGESTDKGIRLAIEEQNRKGGVKGKQVALKTLDDQGKPEEAAAIATRLITQDHVKLILGPETSGRSLQVAPICDANKVPMITNTATNPAVTKDGEKTRPYVFRVCFIDPFQGTAMAKFSREVLKVYQVAVLRMEGEPYSMGLADYFTAKFKEMGGSIVADQSYRDRDKDFKSQLTIIKSRNPQAIYVPGYQAEVPLIARQARELGIRVPFLGGDGWDSPELYKVAQGALDGSYWTNHFSDQDPSPAIQDFVRKYKAAFGGMPDAFVVLGYDAARVAFDSMERARDLSGPAIRDAIEQTKGYQAVSGVITLDADHNAVKPAVVLSIDKGTSYFAATITP